MPISSLERSRQLRDRLRLVAPRFVIGFQLKRHRDNLALQGQSESEKRVSLRCYVYLAVSLSLLSAGTQAVGLCAQRVFNPLPHVNPHAQPFPRQRSATPLGAQAGMPVFRALPEARMSPPRLC